MFVIIDLRSAYIMPVQKSNCNAIVQFQCAPDNFNVQTSTISMCKCNQYNFNVQPAQFQCANATSTISKCILDLELVHFKLERPQVYSFIRCIQVYRFRSPYWLLYFYPIAIFSCGYFQWLMCKRADDGFVFN